MRMKFDEEHAKKLAGLLGAMCIDHVDLLVDAVRTDNLSVHDLVKGGLPSVAAGLIIREVKASSQPPSLPQGSSDIQLDRRYWLDGGAGLELMATGKVVIASGYYNSGRYKRYKFKLSTDFEKLDRERVVLEDIAR
jgi:hypothetical protein